MRREIERVSEGWIERGKEALSLGGRGEQAEHPPHEDQSVSKAPEATMESRRDRKLQVLQHSHPLLSLNQ